MSKFLLLFVTIIASFEITAQTKKTFIVNPGQKLVEAIPAADLYLRPQFTLGTVQMKDASEAVVKLNYNYVFEEMQYIDPKTGDTLSLAEEKNIRFVAIEKDTFYFDELWVHYISGNSTLKIAKAKSFEMSNREKLGALDSPTTGSIDTYTKYTGSQHMKDLVAKERLTYKERINYYFGDRFNHFSRANKKELVKMYRNNEKKLEKWLDENKIDLANEDDLKKLCIYLETL